ncbi:MAG: GAF domain-containing protein [Leptolyngbya sp.]|nr:GAF domain-containing protein [Candidatus Melainabacteria bacterium]
MKQDVLDYSNCETEQIHLLGSIQPHGFLLAFNLDDLIVENVSVNFELVTGRKYQELIGTHLREFVGIQRFFEIEAALKGDDLKSICPFTMFPNDMKSTKPFQVNIHKHDGLLILEGEPFTGNNFDETRIFRQAFTNVFPELFSAKKISDLLAGVATEVQRISDFDRVLIYQFDPDWHGTVVAEQRRDFMGSYLNHSFPATDIPQQARELYVRNKLRVLVDVNASPAAIFPVENKRTGKPIDLSFSTLRSMSPVHVEYLQNMNVTASMSISILKDERLWALIVCHHNREKTVDYRTRSILEFLAQLLSTLVSRMENSEELEHRLYLKRETEKLLFELSQFQDIKVGFERVGEKPCKIAGSGGFAIFHEKEIHSTGIVPCESDLVAIGDWLNARTEEKFFFTNKFSENFSPANEYRGITSGVLAIPLSQSRGSWLVWFRPERIKEIQWAGGPQDSITIDESDQRIRPRKSFELWKEQIFGTCDPWTESEIVKANEFASGVTQLLLEKFLRQLEVEEQINKEREEFYQQREDWLAALAHDLQTPAIGAKLLFELLLKGSLGKIPEHLRSVLEKLEDSNSGQLSRILKLVEVFKYETKARALSIRPVDLEKTISICIAKLEPFARSRKVTIFSTCSIKGASALADVEALEQLLSNVLDNAIKFSRESGTVEISCELSKSKVHLHVLDHGIGISEEDQKYLFERFWQGGSPGKYHVSVGLGLYLARQIADRMGCDITCVSEVEKGSVFTVTLPTM